MSILLSGSAIGGATLEELFPFERKLEEFAAEPSPWVKSALDSFTWQDFPYLEALRECFAEGIKKGVEDARQIRGSYEPALLYQVYIQSIQHQTLLRVFMHKDLADTLLVRLQDPNRYHSSAFSKGHHLNDFLTNCASGIVGRARINSQPD